MGSSLVYGWPISRPPTKNGDLERSPNPNVAYDILSLVLLFELF